MALTLFCLFVCVRVVCLCVCIYMHVCVRDLMAPADEVAEEVGCGEGEEPDVHSVEVQHVTGICSGLMEWK